MAQSIKNRDFGSDVPSEVKDKIQKRQALALSSTNPLDPITGNKLGINSNNYNSNFNGLLDLSSRTPAVRMWTCINISQDIKKEELLKNEQDVLDWWEEKDNPNSELSKKDAFLRKIDKNTFEEHEWKKLKDSKKIYQIGNHIYNTFEINPQSQISKNVGEGESELGGHIVRAISPNEQEIDRNAFLKPSAGITSVSSETEGTLGAIKKTTVSFVVHNFSDFEKIYLRYFLKPGAQIFVDYGWDTGLFYDPKKIMEDTSKLQNNLFGDNGYITLSKGDMDTIFGNVVNYSATAREDGGFDCSVEIVSKNTALLSTTIDTNFQDKVSKGLDIEILGAAVAGVTGNPSISVLARQWGQHSNNETQLRVQLVNSALEMLGGSFISQPGLDGEYKEASRLASRFGIFITGTKDKHVPYVNFGWFEDNFLNKELGFSDNERDLINASKESSNKDSEKMLTKFNSRNFWKSQ